MAEEKKKVITIHLPRMNLWMIATLVLAVVLVVVLLKGFSITGWTVLTSQQAADKAIDYINKNLVQTGNVSLVSVEELSGFYEVTTSYQGQKIPVYVTKDGSYLFISQPLNMNEEITTTTTQPQKITKKDRPTVELFVMSFCPYGVQAETLMKPVVDLLGTKADIKVRFIVNIQGNTVDSVESLHGATEAQEDLRQVCIMKYYDQKTYWNYLMEIDNNCYGKINTRDATALDTCWKSAATKAGIDIAKIQSCSNSTEGLNLLKADEQLTDQYGVSGSPTIVINGARYSGARDSESFKQAICNSFTTAPSECSQTLSSSGGSSTSGGCQ
jgi:predicted DsbA family dithiol-disulfide isomerase